MKPALESEPRPAARSATSLGRLIASCGQLPRGGARAAAGRTLLWSNRPGQDREETFTLAVLIMLTATGLAAGWIAEWLSPVSAGAWLMVAALTVPGFFIVIHLLIFAAAVIDALIRRAGIRVFLPPGHFCGRLFLGLLTALCLLELGNPDAGAWLRSVSACWVAVACLNVLAWFLATALELFRELANHHPD